MNKDKNWLGFVIFISLGLVVFFISAFFVVTIRTRNTGTTIMPDVVGQNYSEVHNELARLRFKVRIESSSFMDKNDGEILSQSIPAGKKVEAGSKVYLTVNLGIEKIVVPDLKGQQLASAKATLEKILTGDRYVSVLIGGITYVPPEPGQSADTVIDQMPEAGKNTTTREKMYLLVTESKPTARNYKGIPFPIVNRSLQITKSKFKIEDIVSTKDPLQNGQTEDCEVKSGIFSCKVMYHNYEKKLDRGYEVLKYKMDSSNNYSLIMESEFGDKKKSETLFSEVPFREGEELKFLFYREGYSKLKLLAGGKEEKTFKFKGELP